MRKADIIEQISVKTGISKEDVLLALESFFTEVKQAVLEGEGVSIHGFGSFNVVKRAGRQARDINKSTAMYVPEHYIPKFKPAKEFMNALKSVEIKKP